MEEILEFEKVIKKYTIESLPLDQLRYAKSIGFSDKRISRLLGVSEKSLRDKRTNASIRPSFKTVDTCAAEFSSFTPYFYSSYEEGNDAIPTKKKKIVILGGGPNRIGQGLEFDYCCVHASMALREAGFETIMINCNPETVSTDYDTSDRLYFEPLTLEDVLEIVHLEKPQGVIVQYGGQTPLRLSLELKAEGVPIIGTSPESIELTEDRKQFSALISELNILQAESGTATNKAEALAVAGRVGYPLMVRPSYVLGGRAMAIIHEDAELEKYIDESVEVSFDRPVLLDRFLDDAIEVDVDAIYDGKDPIICGIVEHIERAGVHSGDSSFTLPTQTLPDSIVKEIEVITKRLLKACGVIGLMNVQYAVRKGGVYVLEVNPRASRSVPFVSKVVGVPWAKVAACVMAGSSLRELADSQKFGPIFAFENYLETAKKMPFVAVKESVFPFIKFPGVDAILGPEMRSTGEVMGIDVDAAGGFLRAQKASGQALPKGGTVFFSLKEEDKERGLSLAKKLIDVGFKLIGTSGTASFLKKNGIEINTINKVRDGSPHIVDALKASEISLVINTPEGSGPLLDSRTIRSTAVQMKVPLITTIAAAESAVISIDREFHSNALDVKTIQEYLKEFHSLIA